MNPVAKDILMHYGMPYRSGRYPYGSGKNPFQHCDDFLSRVNELKEQGMSEKEIAESIGLTTTQLRIQKSLAKNERRSYEVDTAKKLKAKGYNPTEIARMMGYNSESSVRSLLNEKTEERMNSAKSTADFLKKQIDERGMIEVGAGVEKELNITREKLEQALYILELEGYPHYSGGVPQVTNPGKQTTIKVIGPPGTKHKDIYDYKNVHTLTDYISYDNGETFKPAFVFPKSMDSKRIKIRYSEDGGKDKDGVIEIRRGVKDLSLGDSRYAQVRILVDGDRYLKGMAVYSDDMPDGVDIVFNTNKPSTTPLRDVLKKAKRDKDGNIDRDNPFGSLIKERGGQSYYIDDDGKEQLSLINKRADEGDWVKWTNELSAQFLAKQNKALIDKQLGITIKNKVAEFNDICEINNPTIKRNLLKTFADDCDSAAVHLKAASLPRQHYQVILPLPNISDKEVYAPNYNNGETVALVRYPHAGPFEIPILKVNNKLPEGKKLLGTNPKDAIGINSKVAEQLSGADFDGDSVMVIPCNSASSKVHITATKPLKDLEGFDPKIEYGGRKKGTFRLMKNTQNEMGVISNLITDMELRGATEKDLAKAVKHSMVVIDAEKHELDYKQSEVDNDIAALKRKYQGHIGSDGKYHEGASTLISRAKSKQDVLKRVGSPKIDPNTGEVYYKQVREEYVDKDGNTRVRTQKSTKMAEAKDAYSLVSEANTDEERAYAEFANKMKSLANQSRKEMLNTGKLKYNPEARVAYKNEVNSLTANLNIALKNAPRERKAQLIANTIVAAKKKEYPDMTKAEQKKISQQALINARNKVGARRHPIPISDKEWEAIQSGAIRDSQLEQILRFADIDDLRQRATPRAKTELSDSKINRIKSMSALGYTNADIANALGVSTTTVSNYLK